MLPLHHVWESLHSISILGIAQASLWMDTACVLKTASTVHLLLAHHAFDSDLYMCAAAASTSHLEAVPQASLLRLQRLAGVMLKAQHLSCLDTYTQASHHHSGAHYFLEQHVVMGTVLHAQPEALSRTC